MTGLRIIDIAIGTLVVATLACLTALAVAGTIRALIGIAGACG